MVEPVEAWRFLARKIKATRNVAAQLLRGTPAGPDWHQMHEWPEPLSEAEVEILGGSLLPRSRRERGPRPPWIAPPQTALDRELGRPPRVGQDASAGDSERIGLALELNWRTVAQVATQWLEFGGVHPRLYPALRSKAQAPLFLAHGWTGLSGALAMQLADGLAHGEQFVCDLCFQPFSTNNRRRPSARDPHHYCKTCTKHDYREVKKALARQRYNEGRPPTRRSLTHPNGPKRT
jgi:hypothetical protein